MKIGKTKPTFPFIDFNPTFKPDNTGIYIGVDLTKGSTEYMGALISLIKSTVKNKGLYEDIENLDHDYSPHITVMYDNTTPIIDIVTEDFLNKLSNSLLLDKSLTFKGVELFGENLDYCVVTVEPNAMLTEARQLCVDAGFTPTFAEYNPHITLLDNLPKELRTKEFVQLVTDLIEEYSYNMELSNEIDIGGVEHKKVLAVNDIEFVENVKCNKYQLENMTNPEVIENCEAFVFVFDSHVVEDYMSYVILGKLTCMEKQLFVILRKDDLTEEEVSNLTALCTDALDSDLGKLFVVTEDELTTTLDTLPVN